MNERDLVITDVPSATPSSAAAPRSLLATPLGLALVIPLLVLIAGGGAGWLAWRAARDVVRIQAGHLLVELGQAKRNDMQIVLESGGAMLDGLRLGLTATPDLQDDQAAIRVLLPVLRGRSGVAMAHVAYPDGRWYAMARESQDRSLVRTVRQTDGSLHLVAHSLDGEGRLNGPERERPQAFDPRQRPFWQVANRLGRRAWTEPYRFFQSGLPGISLCEPIFGPDGRLAMVLSIDFDLDSLGQALGGSPDRVAGTVIFTADRTLLAVPHTWTLASAGLANVADLTTPEAVSCFAAIADRGLPKLNGPPVGGGFHTPDGNEWGVSVTTLALPDGPVWYVAEVADREFLLGRSDEVATRGFSVAIGVLVVAVGAGLWFARHLAQARRDSVVQRDRAHAAEAKVKEMGSYRLTKCLGKGGMGEVWLAHHRLLARPAAVKLITRDYLGHNEDERRSARLRFEREARITASLRSRATIDLYDYGVAADGTWFYVMELLDGLDLRHLVQQYGPQPIGRIVRILTQACASLAEAHDRGLVHRDIKPDNLYLCRLADEVDLVKVLDFGIVADRTKRSPSLTQAGYVQGTPTTMAPEQAMGGDIDGRVDIYALGCVAYFLATGQEVFDGDAYEMVGKHVSTQPMAPSLRSALPLPRDFDELVLTCLAKDREQRPRDARVLAAALGRLSVFDDQAWDAASAQTWWRRHMPRPVSEDTTASAPPQGPV